MELTIAKDMNELSENATIWIADRIRWVLKNEERFTLVLSGGNTPRSIYQLLASGKHHIDWSRVHFFWGDERFVPLSDERNNARMAFDNLLDLLPILPDQVHVMRTDIPPDEAAAEYEQVLRNYFPDSSRTFDLVLLGMGEDGHTLSLFPGYAIIDEKEAWVKPVYLEEQKMNRITLTTPVVNAAASVLFLVSGKDKANALRQVLEGPYNPLAYPAQKIHPTSDQLFWMVDDLAAALLNVQ